MGPRRLGLSAIDKRDVWSRWKAGQTLHEIGRVYGKCHNAIRTVLLPRGGIPPVARRRSRHASEHGHRRGQIVDAVSIRERPPEAEDRAIPGHWEGDLLAGGKNSYIATLVERHSRFLMLVKVPSKDTAVVVSALSERVGKLPTTLRRSLTWDRGLEMAKHKEFTVATDVQVYFCDPQSPWQRGSNENTNLLLRQYFPRGTDLSSISQEQLDQVELLLNQRPRKTLGFDTPASKLQASVASTV
jgi:IS30 family transposase